LLRESEALKLVSSLPEVFDEPFADSSALPQLAVARVAREHVTVALSGDGGDELFGGYLRYRARPFLGMVEHMPRAVARATPVAARVPGVGRRLALLTGLAAADSAGAAYRELVSVWKTPQLRRLMSDVTDEDALAARFDATAGGAVERMMRCDARTYLVGDILQKVDRATMAVSLEGRNPLLDPEVADLAFQSVAVAERGPARKPLLRAALRLLLPADLVDRPKMGFAVPIGKWLRGGLKPLVEDLVLADHAARDFEPWIAQELARDHLNGRHDRSAQVWSLLVYQLWRNRWAEMSRRSTP
jgi:asparagine synthase (glutamine-hydrolysing)